MGLVKGATHFYLEELLLFLEGDFAFLIALDLGATFLGVYFLTADALPDFAITFVFLFISYKSLH